MLLDSPSLELPPHLFAKIGQLVRRLCGIELAAGKEDLVKCRLGKRVRALGLDSFEAYVAYVERDVSQEELSAMIDALTTNKTGFFRESQHFDYLREHVLPRLAKEARRIRFWSAGCSSGEEPYSLAILLRKEIPGVERRDVRILATDISSRMLEKARRAVYGEEELGDLPPELRQKYFSRDRDLPANTYRLNDDVRAMVRLARLNLMDPWPMRGPFQVVFCRNVMIYFARATREELTARFWELLAPGGVLCVGHAESLGGDRQGFRYVQPAVYVK